MPRVGEAPGHERGRSVWMVSRRHRGGRGVVARGMALAACGVGEGSGGNRLSGGEARGATGAGRRGCRSESGRV